MFVGPPGSRKTTSIDSGSLVLLNQVNPGLNIGADAFTKEGVVESMQRASDNSICIVLGEFSDAMQKAGKDRSGMYEFLTSMFDGKATYSTSTKTSGSNLLEKPCLNFFSATTPGWIKDNMPESVISGGFASRVIFVYEEGPRINKMFFDDVEGEFPPGHFMKLEDDLLMDLMHISTELSGEFSFSEDGLLAAREWSEKPHAQNLLKNDKLAGYLNRKKTHVAKLAQIHSIATKDELVITKEDWDFGVYAIESTEEGIGKIFAGVGKNPFTNEIEKIVSYVKSMNFFTGEKVSRAELLRAFMHSAEPRKLNDLIQIALDSKLLKAKDVWIDGQHDFNIWHPEFIQDE
jgi:hypothetical protein